MLHRRPVSNDDDALARGLTDVDDRLRGLVAGAPMTLFLLDAHGRVLHAGGTGGPDTGWLKLLPVRAAVAAALAGESVADTVETETGMVGLTAVPGPDGGVIVVAHALDRLRHAGLRLAHDAFVDRLTGLATRSHFLDRVEEARARARQDATAVAVLLMDLDRFAMVNDALGYARGDRVLVAVADRLHSLRRHGEIAARVGGDEFAVLCEGLDGADEAMAAALRLQERLAPPFVADGRELFLSATVGVGLDRVGAVQAEAILLDAAAAVRRARERGRGRCELYDDDLREATARRIDMRSALVRALDRDELCLHYQPVVSVRTGAPVGVEALVRWDHPVLGLVPPDHFVPVAEETGLIATIGRWVLRQACDQMAAWRGRLDMPPEFRVSVNLSAAQLHERRLAGDVAHTLEDAGLEPDRLTLEITESMLLEDEDWLVQSLSQLRNLGVGIAVDDFGTGWSALGYLKRLPVDVIKVDRTFVNGLVSSRADRAIAEAVVGLARALDLTAVAEGVETRRQLDAVRSMGCESAQGFLFSKPLHPDEAEAFLAAKRLTSGH
jgi:diguanylate cyclase (GGDEF)-like protein